MARNSDMPSLAGVDINGHCSPGIRFGSPHWHRRRSSRPSASLRLIDGMTGLRRRRVWLDPVVHPFHVVTLIPSSWEAVARFASFTVCPFAEIRIQSVVVLSMSFALMTEEACIRRKPGVLAVISRCGVLAFVWPEMGIQIFAVTSG